MVLKETLRGIGQKKKQKNENFGTFTLFLSMMADDKTKKKQKKFFFWPLKSGKNGPFYEKLLDFWKKIIMDFWHHGFSFWPILMFLGLFYSHLDLNFFHQNSYFCIASVFHKMATKWPKRWKMEILHFSMFLNLKIQFLSK